jgi:hypothetical protein
MLTLRGVLTASAVTLTAALGAPSALSAQVEIGTWVRKGDNPAEGSMTMTVEACCGGGRKLTYNLTMKGTNMVMTVESPFDGTEVPVLVDGKPSAETMAIKRIDAHHATTVLKMNGQPFGTSKATLSDDGKMLTVVNDIVSAGGPQPKGLQTEIWIKK